MKTLALLVCLFTPVIAFADKSFNEGKGGTVDCAKDAETAININNGTFTFKGACTTITVNGNNNKITIENVSVLAINGNENAVTAKKADTIAVNGNKNKATYSGKATVADNGTGNKLDHAK